MKITLPFLTLAACFAPCLASAAVITIDVTDGGPGIGSLSSLGGYVPATSIQNIASGSGSLVAKTNTNLASFLDSTGAGTSVSISSSSGWGGGSYQAAAPTGFGTTADSQMMQNYLEVSGTATVTFSGLNAWLSSQGATAYNIYVMSDTGSTLGAATFTVGSQSNYLANGGTPMAGPYQLGSFATLDDAKAAPNTANMVKFSNVTGDSFTLQVAKDGGMEGWIPLNMIQIEAIPEPSVALLGGLSALGLLVRRRR